MSASQKLSHLLQLADQGPALRAALAEEVAELLTDWPADYPDSMRGVCEALLAKAAREVDAATRARLRVQLYADPDLAGRVLPRESAGADADRSRPRAAKACPMRWRKAWAWTARWRRKFWTTKPAPRWRWPARAPISTAPPFRRWRC